MTNAGWHASLGFGLVTALVAGCGAPGTLPTAAGHPATPAATTRHVLDEGVVPLIPKHVSGYHASSERPGRVLGRLWKYSASRLMDKSGDAAWDKEWANAGNHEPTAEFTVNFDGSYILKTMTIKTNPLGLSNYRVEVDNGSGFTPSLTGQTTGSDYKIETVSFPPNTVGKSIKIHWDNSEVQAIPYFAIFGLQINGVPADTSTTNPWNLGPGGGIPGVV